MYMTFGADVDLTVKANHVTFILDVINAIPTVCQGVGNVMLKDVFSHVAAPMERYVRNLTNLESFR